MEWLVFCYLLSFSACMDMRLQALNIVHAAIAFDIEDLFEDAL